MTVVLKVGGASTGGVAEAIAALVQNGEPVCVVHGAGPQISDEMARRGLEVRFVGGRRITTPEALEVVRESFASVNAAVCAGVGALALPLAGDEIGLEGLWGEDGRRTMPWNQRDAWDTGLLAEYRRLIELRRSSPALARGGIRYAHVGADAVAYLRESAEERLLCLAARADHEPVRLSLHELGASGAGTLYGGDAAAHDGDLLLPGGGPALHVWRLEDCNG